MKTGSFFMCAVGTACPPRGKVTHSDGSGLIRIYAQSVISAMQKHLASTDPELGGPLENLVMRFSTSTNLNKSSSYLLLKFDVLAPGCTSRWSVLSLGVPDPAGLHHGGSARRLDHNPDRPRHLSCVTRHRLVQCQPEPSTESGVG